MTEPSFGIVSPTYPPPGQTTIDDPSGLDGRYTPSRGVVMLRRFSGHFSSAVAGSMDSPPGAWPGHSAMISCGGVSGGTGTKPARPPGPPAGGAPAPVGACAEAAKAPNPAAVTNLRRFNLHLVAR